MVRSTERVLGKGLRFWHEEVAVMSPAETIGPERESSKDKETEIDLCWGLKIPMRDGVNLNSTMFKPKDLRKKTPAIFTLTPYVGDTWHSYAVYFARHGYAFLLVDVRGRGNSEGTYSPFENDAQDGYDITEWLAGQHWCNGKVGMWGGSYGGTGQWSTLSKFPGHLETIVPVASAFLSLDIPHPNNIGLPYIMQWFTMTSGSTNNENIWKDERFWIEKLCEFSLGHLPFRELDRFVGNPSPFFQKWLDHPCQDEYWDSLTPSDDEYRRMGVPILTITGHYDGDQIGAIEHYRRHMLHASRAAKARHYLIIGPWDHAGTRAPQRELGGLKFGDASLLDLKGLLKEWYDWTLKEKQRPAFLKKRVAYYMEGADEWRYAKSLEDVWTSKRRFHLDSSNGEANDAFHSGLLTRRKPKKSKRDTYEYNPLDTRPIELEREEIKNYIIDQRYALNLWGNGVVYHSEPFAEDTEVAGFLRLVVWISMNVTDTDFIARVGEIKPDGSGIALAEDLLRARYHRSLRCQELVKPNAVNRYDFDRFPFFARRISRGSRVRLVLSCPNSIRWEKNYNSGGVVAEESGKDARPAHISVHHDAQHPSFLEVPLAS